MKTIGRLLFAGALFGGVFTACNDDDPVEYDFDARADFFVQKIMVEGEAKYIPTFYAYGNEPLGSVQVYDEHSEETYSLEKYWANENNFRLILPQEQYLDELPGESDFRFVIMSKGNKDTLEVTEAYVPKPIETVEITNAEYENGVIKVEWNTIEDVETYGVKLFNTDGEILFAGGALSAEIDEYVFGSQTEGWFDRDEPLVNDQEYVIQLSAYEYEEDSPVNEKGFNVQHAAVATENIVWNPSEL